MNDLENTHPVFLRLRTREDGRHEYAAELARLAADAYDQTFAMENREDDEVG